MRIKRKRSGRMVTAGALAVLVGAIFGLEEPVWGEDGPGDAHLFASGPSSWPMTGDRSQDGWALDSLLAGDFLMSGFSSDTQGLTRMRTGSALGNLHLCYARDIVYFDVRLHAAYGLTKISGERARKSIDRFRLEIAHVWRIDRWINPYLRFDLLSHFTEGKKFFSTPSQVRVVNQLSESSNGPVRAFKVTTPFDPLQMGEGAGMHFPLIMEPNFRVSVQLGLAARQQVTHHYFVRTDHQDTPEIEFKRMDGYSRGGGEFVADAFWVPVERIALSTELDAWKSFKGTDRLLWLTEANIQLVRYLFLNGAIWMHYDEENTGRVEWNETMTLRFAIRLR